MSQTSQHQLRQRLESWAIQYGPALRAHLLALVRRDDLADDLLQETFRRAWRSLPKYQEQNRERAWLFCLADRTASDYWRRVGREPLVVATDLTSCNGSDGRTGDFDWDMVDASSPDPLATLMAHEEQAEAVRLLDYLSESQRRVLLLRFFGELEFADIAAHLEQPLGTILSHAHRGLAKLRTLLTRATTPERSP